MKQKVEEHKATILIVDDEKDHAEAICEGLEKVGYDCIVATSGQEGLNIVHNEDVDLVIVDLVIYDIDGLKILKEIKQRSEDIEVIMITGKATVESAVEAMENGAYTYLMKPLNIKELRTRVAKALERRKLVKNNIELHKQLDKKFGFEGIIGNSPPMIALFDTLQQIAPTDISVLITGESGTGKELVAQAIHRNSKRKNYPFVVLHCASISEGIMESELFGHEKGAFTGAISMRKGRFEYANHGTVFLDEVAEMPESTQVKLLRVLENGEIMRVGSNEPIHLDVRIIAATNKDLETEVNEGRFREDLYFRLKVSIINLLPLRQRRQDIPLLIDAFMNEFADKHNRNITGMTPEARNILYNAPWPGNVRELRNTIENMVVMSRSSILTVDDIPESLNGVEITSVPHHSLPQTQSEAEKTQPDKNKEGYVPGASMEEMEEKLIRDTLNMTNGNRKQAAKILSIGERTLYRKMKKYNIS